MRRHAAPYTRGFVSTNAAATHTHTSTHAVKHTRGFEAHRTQAIHHTLKSEKEIFLQRGITNRRVQAAPMWWKLKGADMLSACASMCQHKSAYVIIRDTDMPEVEGGRYVDFSIVVQ